MVSPSPELHPVTSTAAAIIVNQFRRRGSLSLTLGSSTGWLFQVKRIASEGEKNVFVSAYIDESTNYAQIDVCAALM